jgi:hypothetical protein
MFGLNAEKNKWWTIETALGSVKAVSCFFLSEINEPR